MSLFERVRYWHATADDREQVHPADRHAPPGAVHLVRAIDVDAPAEHVYRWLCQLSVAPYSYDWLDNLGRRSPRRLTPDADRLSVGQTVMVARLVEVAPGRYFAGVALPRPQRMFGPFAVSYEAVPHGDGARIVVCLAVGTSGPLGGVRRALLAAGDLVMMRKQLLNLKRNAEATSGRAARRTAA